MDTHVEVADTESEKFHSPKLCGNCVFPQNFHTRKLGEIMVFFAVRGYVIFLIFSENYRPLLLFYCL